MQCGAEAVRATFLLSALTTLLLTLVPVADGSPATVLSAGLLVVLSAALVCRARTAGRPTLRVDVSPDAPARDERCRGGVFRRQSSPGVPGRARPRAPQPR